MSNGSFYSIMDDVNYCLLGSIGQAASDAQALQVWTQSSMNKSDEWLTGKSQDGSWVDQQLEQEINQLGTGGINPNNQDSPEAVANWIKENCPGGANGINSWSSALVIMLQEKITQLDTSSKWNAVVGAVGPFSSMISSAMTQDTTTSGTLSKNMQSQLQTDNSALQPIADFGSTNAQNIGTISNILAQMSPS